MCIIFTPTTPGLCNRASVDVCMSNLCDFVNIKSTSRTQNHPGEPHGELEEYLQKALGDKFLGDLREALLEVLQDVVVELRSSLRHPGPHGVKEPTAANAATTLVLSSPSHTQHNNTTHTHTHNEWQTKKKHAQCCLLICQALNASHSRHVRGYLIVSSWCTCVPCIIHTSVQETDPQRYTGEGRRQSGIRKEKSVWSVAQNNRRRHRWSCQCVGASAVWYGANNNKQLTTNHHHNFSSTPTHHLKRRLPVNISPPCPVQGEITALICVGEAAYMGCVLDQ